MRKILFAIFWLAGILSAGCSDPNEGKMFAALEEESVASYLEKDGNFSEWVAMLKEADLYNAMTVRGNLTCFVPTDEAVAAYKTKLGREMTREDVLYLVRYHTLFGYQLLSNALKNGRLVDTTAAGNYLVTRFETNGNLYVNDIARVVDRDIITVNGVIHVIDHVIEPIYDTLWDLVRKDNDFSLFAAALEATGINEVIHRLTHAGGARYWGSLFAVSDATYAEEGISSLDELKTLLGSGGDPTEESDPLYRYVAYHLLPGFYTFSDLATLPEAVKERNIETFAKGCLTNFKEEKGFLYLNDTLSLLHTDLQARNGVIHEIDGYMPLYNPRAVLFELEFTDPDYYPQYTLLTLFRNMALAGGTTLGEYEYLTVEEYPFMRIETIPEGTGYVAYNLRTHWPSYGCWNGDILEISLGYVGSFEFELPTIVKGKYKVTIFHQRLSGKGACQVVIDDKIIGEMDCTTGSYNAAFSLKPIGSITFTENTSHTLRFVALRSGALPVDRIIFEPVN
ncbi:MAG: fasciclin domain-containing protein [Odoribacteraceae bacterium]|jgi:uncharacterized surface protein with fasciclin (FAS1) repeats|nr:fasciclin domain-containing protein [Odoribacteraceae bacterium]